MPWSAPTIEAEISAAHAAGARDVVIQACGFLVDHTEVLFDLDVEARAQCAGLGLGFMRARCVHEHPAFISGLAIAVLAL